MGSEPKNRETGIPGGQVILDVKFLDRSGGNFVDDDRFISDGTLPIVEIYDPNNTLISSSATPGEPIPTRLSIGIYEYNRVIGLNDEKSNQWKIIWKIRINGNDLTFEEFFSVVEPGDAEFGDSEFRTGYAFNKPDLTSNYHYPNWGYLLHPDELRFMVGFGFKLVSPDANQTYDDNMLQWYIDVSLGMIERDLDIDLLPRTIRYQDLRDRTTGIRKARTDLDTENAFFASTGSEKAGRFYIREAGYPYRNLNANNYMFIKLRRRPLREVNKVTLQDPLSEGSIIDLLPWAREKLGFESRLQFYPDIQTLGGSPYVPTQLFRINYPFNHFPDAFLIDYETGYLNASLVPMEFRGVMMWTAGILLMEDLSDGRAPGISSASVNLNSISESYSTTQSATNSLLGARIAYYKKRHKEWMQINGHKYRRNLIGVL